MIICVIKFEPAIRNCADQLEIALNDRKFNVTERLFTQIPIGSCTRIILLTFQAKFRIFHLTSKV